MNRVFIIICCLLFSVCVNASYHDTLIANIQYDWINKTELEKDEIINEIHDIMFETPVEKKKDLKTIFKDKLKEKNHIENYYAASAGYKEFKGNNISAFYAGKSKNIYMYALQDKKDVTKSFYYDALGGLRYVDFMEGEYPDYPYYTIQYRRIIRENYELQKVLITFYFMNYKLYF